MVTGAGGIGTAVARRLGSGRVLFVADVARRLGSGRVLFVADVARGRLDRTVAALRAEGHEAHGLEIDVRDRPAVRKLAETAAGEGRLAAVVHTAGVCAATASARTNFEVHMAGTAHVTCQADAPAVDDSGGAGREP